MNSQRLAAPYFVLQGSAVLLWWLLLWQVPFTRQYFLPPHAPEWLLLVFALPDIALAGLGSFAAAALLWRAHTFAAAGFGAILIPGALLLGLAIAAFSLAGRQTASFPSWVTIAGFIAASHRFQGSPPTWNIASVA